MKRVEIEDVAVIEGEGVTEVEVQIEEVSATEGEEGAIEVLIVVVLEETEARAVTDLCSTKDLIFEIIK